MKRAGSMRLRMAATATLLLVVLVVGCGGESGGSAGEGDPRTTTRQDTTAQESVRETAGRLLDDWSEQLVPVLLTARQRREADEAGDIDEASRLGQEMNRGLRRVQRYGRVARSELLQALETREAKATIAAGDAWTEWAHELLTNPPAGDFDQARHIADLAAEALRGHQAAYRALGREPPVEFQS